MTPNLPNELKCVSASTEFSGGGTPAHEAGALGSEPRNPSDTPYRVAHVRSCFT
jgi:hypothetical protein